MIPAPTGKTEFDGDLIATAKCSYDEFIANMDSFKVADALDSAMNIARRANKYIDETTPWALAKDESKKKNLRRLSITSLNRSVFWACFSAHPCRKPPQRYLPLSEQMKAHLKAPLRSACFLLAEKSANHCAFARIDEQKKLAEIEAELAENN